MCGRFSLRARLERILEELAPVVAQANATAFAVSPRFNIAPTQAVLAIREVAGQREWCHLQWGLIPSWAKDVKGGGSLINARSETVAEKPAFRAAFQRRRCLIPADGFYEWPKTAKRRHKNPFFITVAEERLFTFAGVWETWQAADGTVIESCSILTTTPNALMQSFHDRMPVILHPTDYSKWLDPASDLGALRDLLVPYPADEMHCRQVSAYVNHARNEDPSCLNAPPTQKTLWEME